MDRGPLEPKHLKRRSSSSLYLRTPSGFLFLSIIFVFSCRKICCRLSHRQQAGHIRSIPKVADGTVISFQL